MDRAGEEEKYHRMANQNHSVVCFFADALAAKPGYWRRFVGEAIREMQWLHPDLQRAFAQVADDLSSFKRVTKVTLKRLAAQWATRDAPGDPGFNLSAIGHAVSSALEELSSDLPAWRKRGK